MLGPDTCAHGTHSDPNNDSVVIRLTWEGHVVLFGGDAEVEEQQPILDRGTNLRAAILKVPHHGGDTNVFEFLQSVHEAVAIVSTGPNTYGDPVPKVLEELRITGARVFRTDHSGDVVATFTDRGLAVRTAHGRAFEFPGRM